MSSADVVVVDELLASQQSAEVNSADLELDPVSAKSDSLLSQESVKESSRLSKSKSARSDTPVPSARKSNDDENDEQEEQIEVPKPISASSKGAEIEEVTEATTKKSIFERLNSTLGVKILIILTALLCAGAAVVVEPSWMVDTCSEMFYSMFAMVQKTEAAPEIAVPHVSEQIPEPVGQRMPHIPTRAEG